MGFLFLLTLIVFFTWIIRNTLFWLHLWQIKEYRLDRMLVHFKETTQGRNLILGVGNSAKNVAFFLFILFNLSFGINLGSWYDAFVLLIFTSSFAKLLWEIKNKTLRIPTFTPKIIAIFIIVIGIELFFYLTPLFNNYFWLIFLDRLVPFIITAFIWVLAVPSDFYKDILIKKAVKKMRKSKDLLVIGITGSYGKGSTKEFLSTVLSHKKNVLKTQGTFNTPVGIAKTVLSGLNPSTEIFIVEMGAYKKGEIAEMCYMVQPKIGILTSVNTQHVSLFGSLDNIKKTKYELIEFLPEDGFALFNGNNAYSLELSKQMKKKKIVYFADYKNSHKGRFDIRAFNIKPSQFHIDFDIELVGKITSSFRVNLIGKQNVENILPAIYLAHYLGMSISDISRALNKIVPVRETMEAFISNDGFVVVDDTHNMNPDGVIAACEYMELFKGKKVLVLNPMIELGESGYNDHYNVALQVGEVCDYLFLTNNNFLDAIKEGVEKSGGKCVLKVLDPKEIVELVEQKLGKNDVAVFEGREARKALNLIDHKPISKV